LVGLVLRVIVHRVGVTVQGEGIALGLAAAALLEVSANLCHCHCVFHNSVSLTHWEYGITEMNKSQPLNAKKIK